MPTSTTVSTAGNHGSQQNFALQVRHPPHPPSKTARPAHSHLTPLARLPAQDLLKEAVIVAQGHGGGQNSGKPEQFSGKRARWHVAESPESPATAVKLKYVAQPRPPPEVTEGSKVSAREKLQHIHTVLRVNRRAIFEMGLRVKELQPGGERRPARREARPAAVRGGAARADLRPALDDRAANGPGADADCPDHGRTTVSVRGKVARVSVYG